jgi:hypothetical protein
MNLNVKVGEGDQFQVLAENEQEEKEEILLTAPSVEPAKPKMSSSKAKSSRTRRRDEISSPYVRKMLERQTSHIDKIRLMLQSIRKDTKSTQGQPKLIKQIQSQMKLLQNQLTQIQKIITKKRIATSATRSRKKRQVLRGQKRKDSNVVGIRLLACCQNVVLQISNLILKSIVSWLSARSSCSVLIQIIN